MRSLAANVMLLLIVAGLALLAVLGIARESFYAPGPHADEVVVTVPKGATLPEIAGLLADAGVLPDQTARGIFSGEWIFKRGADYTRRARALKFGEYMIPPGASMDEVLALLTTGGNVRHQVTLAEGLSSWEIVERLKTEDLLTGEVSEVPAEGSLLPETYAINRGDTRANLVERMQAEMQAVLDQAWDTRAEDLPLQSKEELLILASIVEKETRPNEHAKVASVFINRLRRGMRLQTDPTVIYGITLGKGPLGRGLRRSELNKATPYNTYVIDGLPPTPIANPGRQSIQAVANPDETPYLYFVADGTGGHAFSVSLTEHNQNVAKWRKIEAERKASQ